jgi:Fe-S-cluster containining protein
MKSTKTSTTARRSYYNCARCPAYCCAIYDLVIVKKHDIGRIAKHFGVGIRTAVRRFTKTYDGARILRQKADPIFGKACQFLDRDTRQCTIYEARPDACREFPERARCALYDLLTFERKREKDENVVPLIAITFLNPKKWIRKFPPGKSFPTALPINRISGLRPQENPVSSFQMANLGTDLG